MVDEKLLQFKLRVSYKFLHKFSFFCVSNSGWFILQTLFRSKDIVSTMLDSMGMMYAQIVRYALIVLVSLALYCVRERFIMLRKYIEALLDSEEQQNISRIHLDNSK